MRVINKEIRLQFKKNHIYWENLQVQLFSEFSTELSRVKKNSYFHNF